MGLTRDGILAIDDLPRESVAVPEWGGTVQVRTMRGEELDKWQDFVSGLPMANGQPKSIQRIMATLVAMTVCDEGGARIFGDADVDQLNAKSAKVIQRLFAVAKKLNGLTDEAVEDLAKN